MKFSPLFRVFATIGGMVVLLSNLANPPNGRTGAPFDSTCNTAGCHSPANPNFDGTVSISGLPTVIQPSTNYSITLTVNVSAGSPTRSGFQLVAVQGNNTNAGDLQASGDAGTEISGGREYVEHRGGKVFSGGSASWTFTWISPATSNGNIVNFYFTANLANGSGSNNDKIIWGSDSYDFAGSVPLTVNITNVSNVTCFGGNNGSATAVPTGGTPPYNYLWTGGETTATATQLTAGVKSVTVTDAGSQQQIKTVTITQPAQINVATSVQGQVTCTGNAVITATPSGGAGNFSFSWPDGSSGNTLTATQPGSYTVTVTDGSGCTRTASATVSGNTTPPTLSATGGAISCSTAFVTLTATTNAGSASFQWSGPNNFSSTEQNPTVSATGTYTVIVTNNTTGCTNSATASVTGGTTPPTASAAGGFLSCLFTSTQISATTNAGANAAFQWTGPNNFSSTQQNPTVTAPGNYTVVVTNTSNGCTNSATATVTQNVDIAVATASSSGDLTCLNTSVNLIGSSSYGNSTFNWSGPNNFTSNQQNPTGITVAGNYILTVTHDGSGCTSTATATVAQNTAPPNLSVTGGGLLTCTATTTQICGSSTTPNTTFLWTGPSGFAVTTACATANQPGVYTLVVTAPNGCTTSQQTTVSQDITPPGATAVGGTLTCTTTSITLSGNASAPGSTFQWVSAGGFQSNQQNPTTNAAGTYTLTTTGPNGCTSSATAVVSENIAVPTAAVAQPGNLNCNQNQLTLDATASSQGANFSYNWTTTGGNILSGGNTSTPVVDQPGVYVLQISNTTNGCTASAATTVSQSPAVSLSAASQNVSCFGGSNGSATATAAGGVGNLNFLWSNGATTASISNLPAGSYSVSVTDSEGCGQSASATISQPNLLVVNAIATAESAAGANDGTATAAPTGGTQAYSYLWSNNATTATITGLLPSVYTVTVGDANGCTAVQTVTVNAFGCTVAISTTSENVSCNGQADGSATVNITSANQPVQILWTTASGAPVGTSPTISNLAPGNYLVGVLDASNCPAGGSVTISEPPALAANATSTNETAVGANDGTATVSPTGGTSPYSFLWSNGSSTQTISGLAPGVYLVSVIDANDCLSTQSVSVNAFDCALSLNITSTEASCFGLTDGTATVSVSGGTSPFSYLWSNGQTTATATGLGGAVPAVVTVTDAAGCVASQQVLVLIPGPINFIFEAVIQQNICLEDKNSTISLSADGGTPPFSYLWSNGQTAQIISDLANGEYTVTATDSKGCTKVSQTFLIAATDNVPPTMQCPDDVTTCEGSPVIFGTPLVTDNCSLPPNSVVQTAGPASGTVQQPGVYNIKFSAKDALGNGSSCDFDVQVNPTPVVKIVQVKDATAGQSNGAIEISIETGSGCGIKWTGPNGFTSTSEDLTNLAAGTYTAEITCSGCKTTITQEVKSTIGTGQPEAFGGVNIFPNPVAAAAGELFFENKNDYALQVQVFDAKGALLEKLALDGGQTQRFDLTKNSLAAGLYSVRFVRADGKFVVKRFSVN